MRKDAQAGFHSLFFDALTLSIVFSLIRLFGEWRLNNEWPRLLVLVHVAWLRQGKIVVVSF
jgi:hypothetical protein